MPDDIAAEAGPVINTHKRSVVENFIKNIGGKRVLQRILIANNGMAATKFIMSMRQWAYMVLGEFDYDYIVLNLVHFNDINNVVTHYMFIIGIFQILRSKITLLVGDERAIEFVAMATSDDLNANAEFIRLADTYVEVPSGSNKVST